MNKKQVFQVCKNFEEEIAALESKVARLKEDGEMKVQATLIVLNLFFIVLNLAVLWANRPLLLVNGIALVIGTAVMVIMGMAAIEN